MGNLIMIVSVSCLSVLVWESCRYFYRKFIKKVNLNHYVPERHVYPKKDCECDYLGECKDRKNENEEFIQISMGRTIPNPDYVKPTNRVYIESIEHQIQYYMKRNNKHYYRGKNIKVVVTL